MIKVVINRCYGGFGLSTAAYNWLIKNKGWKVTEYSDDGNGYKDPTAQIVDHGSYMMKTYGRIIGDTQYTTTDVFQGNELRTNQDIIDAVKKLGKKASGACAELAIIEIPDDVKDNWEIGEYDGVEWVQEVHRRWS